MHDAPAIATLIFIVAVFAIYGLFSMLGRRALRAESERLFDHHLVHWRYPKAEWQAHCERCRKALWFGVLQPALRYLAPVVVLAAGLVIVMERYAGMSRGLAAVFVLVVMLLVANTILGPQLRGFVRLTRRRDFDYELLIGESGALEVWRDAERLRATEEHPFTAVGARIERAEANGVDPTEIAIALSRPLAFGFLHTEARFLVPAGRIAEAREIARQLAPRAATDHDPPE
jgi:hypothetical protein